jgi:hypothetical protein
MLNTSEMLGKVELFTPVFSLNDVYGFPEAEWLAKRMQYDTWMSWYDGIPLLEKQMQGNQAVDKYPVKLNPIRGAVYKHAYALFGEFKDDSRPLAIPILKPDDRKQKEDAFKGQTWLNNVWYENSGRSLMIRNALLSQILGGSVFKISYIAKGQSWRKNKFRIEAIHPSNFMGIPMAGDEYRLERAWIVKAMSPFEANRVYGTEYSGDQNVYYIEYWTPDEYEISINGEALFTGDFDERGEKILYKGKNPDGFVPICYIPHVRTDDFYGETLVTENVIGIVEELNKRLADYGDAVSDDSHRYYVIKNSSGRPDVYEVAPGVRAIHLTANPQITGRELDPDMTTLGEKSASESMQGLTEELYKNFRREAFIPAVADGEDEGSQRSAQTLAMRMWPLLSHTSMERIYWGDGLAMVDHMLLEMGLNRNVDLPETVRDMRIERRWAPMLPVDREVFINELVNRASVHLGSTEHLLSLLDDIEDPAGEWEAIKNQMKEMATEEAKIQKTLMPEGNPQGGTAPKGTPNPSGAQNKSKSKE